MDPLRATSNVFSRDDNIQKIEQIQYPAVPTDFSHNLQTEIILDRFKAFMQNVMGAVRIDGFDVYYQLPGNITIDPGTILYENFIMEKAVSESFSHITGSAGICYMAISCHRWTLTNHPVETGVSPTGDTGYLASVNQYRHKMRIAYDSGSALPSDTDTGVSESKAKATDGTVAFASNPKKLTASGTYFTNALVGDVIYILSGGTGIVLGAHIIKEVEDVPSPTYVITRTNMVASGTISSIEYYCSHGEAKYVKLADTTLGGVVTENLPEWPGKLGEVLGLVHIKDRDTGTVNGSFTINSTGNPFTITTTGLTEETSVDGNNLYDAVQKKHTQNTDTGTVSESFEIGSTNKVVFSTVGLSAELNILGSTLKNVVDRQHVQNSDTGTTSSTYKIGVGVLGPNLEGVDVLMQVSEPENPLNFRIYDINPTHANKQVGRCRVTFKWGWEYLSGSHFVIDGANTIRVTSVKAGSDALDVGANDLVGCNLYSPNFQSVNQRYLIEGNEATDGGNTVISLESAYNDESMAENGNVVINGDKLEFSIVPNIESEEKNWRSSIVLLSDHYVVNQTYSVDLDMYDEKGIAKYTPKIRAWSGFESSDWVPMLPGTYDPDHQGGGQAEVKYTVPFSCQLPFLDEVTAPGSITLVATLSGFSITVGGWEVAGDLDKTAHLFEVVQTTLDTIDWTDYTNSIRKITRDRIVDVPCSYIRKWSVGVRPLQNTQVVGTAKTGTVVSGSMGVAPSDQAILNGVEVDLRTYSGTLSVITGKTVSLSALKSPALSGATSIENAARYLSSRDAILKDSADNSFIVIKDSVEVDAGVGVILTLVNLSGEVTNPVNGAFEINTTERGRRLKVLNAMQIEMDSVIGYFDSDVITGATVDDPGILRVCQNSDSGKTYADLLSVFETDTAYEFITDFIIRNSFGNLGLLFDAFDPSIGSPNNYACIRGRFTLYMVPRVQKMKEAR